MGGGIKSVLRRVSHAVGQVCIPCRFFGSNGHETKPVGLVIESYTKRAASKKWQPKSIVNPRLIYGPFIHKGDTAGKTLYISAKKLCVNHYYCKSWQEYTRRKTRGDSAFGKAFAANTFNRNEFDRHDKNEVYDDAILRFAPAVRRALKK